MKLRDFGETQSRDWFMQILQWSQGKITFEDNVDCKIITPYINTTETSVGHALGRIPKIVIPIMQYPHGTQALSFTKDSTIDTIYISRATAGYQALIIS